MSRIITLLLAAGLVALVSGCATTEPRETLAEAQYEICQPGSAIPRKIPEEPPEWMKKPRVGTCIWR